MPKYLTRLYDDYSKIVLTNTRDLDARDEEYAEKVSSVVWAAVTKLRQKRIEFRDAIKAELRNAKRRRSEPA